MPKSSPMRVKANQANAQRSTGPKTAEGKSRSSLNAVKTGLAGRLVLLPSDDADAYREHVKAYVAEFAPVGLRESALVQSLADHAWRLERLVMLEMGIYAVGHAELAKATVEHPNVIQVWTHLTYEKQLRNLHIQEGRLRRHREKDLAELKELQQARLAAQKAVGFEFSTPTVARAATPAASTIVSTLGSKSPETSAQTTQPLTRRPYNML